MPENNTNPQDQRSGGYGGSTGGEDPTPEKAGADSTSATGRESPVRDAVDADEALGNRTGGYGGNPASTDEPGTRTD